MNKKTLAIFVACIALMFPTYANASVQTPGDLSSDLITPEMLREKLPIPMVSDAPEDGYTRLQAGHAFLGGQNAFTSQLSHVQITQDEANSDTWVCEGYLDPDCAGLTKTADILLPLCSDEPGPCIENFSIVENGLNFPGAFSRYVDNAITDGLKAVINSSNFLTDDQSILEWQETYTWSGDSSKNFPSASSPSLWTVDQQENVAGANTYMVRAMLTFQYADSGNPVFTDMAAEVIPYKEITRTASNPISFSDFHPPVWYTRHEVNADLDGDGADDDGPRTESFPNMASHPLASFDNPGLTDPVLCAFEEMGTCGVALKFDEDKKVELTLRIPKEFGGWFHGRLSDTKVDLSEYNQQLNRIKVSANPVTVPISSLQFEPCAPENESAGLNLMGQEYLEDFCEREASTPPEPYGLAWWGQWSPLSDRAVEMFTDFENYIDADAKGELSMWSFGSLPFDAIDGSCFSDTEVQGVISTNAMVYQAGLPVLSDRGFSYRLAGTHNDMYENPFRGDYTLEMRSSVARCIYNLGTTPFEASVTVTASAGNAKPSVTSISESDGWLRITARNFTFSESRVNLLLRAKAQSSNASVTSSQPSVTKNAKLRGTQVANLLGLNVSKNSVLKISIPRKSQKICGWKNSRLVALKPGICTLTVTVQEPKPKTVKVKSTFSSVGGAVLTRQQAVEQVGRTFVPGSKVTIIVSAKSRKACSVKSGKLVVKPGAECNYSVSISEPRPKPAKVTSAIQVN